MVITVLFVIFLFPHLSLGYAFGNDLSYEGDDYVLALVNLTWVNKLTQTIHSEKDDMARFGNSLVSSVQGVVVHVKTSNGSLHDGCEMPFENDIPNEPWVALISLGGCGLDEKIKNAYMMNASAVAIYNNKKNGFLKMRLQTEYRLKIVAITLSKAKGELVASWVDNGTKVVMEIEVGTQFSYKPYNINRVFWKNTLSCRSGRNTNCLIITSVLFVSISFIVLMIISLAWLVLYYVQRFRYIHAKDQLSKQLCSAAKKALSKIPERTLRGSNKEFERDNECCAVCIEPYRNHDVVRSLPCNHEFHKICIDPWLLTHRTCPMCKMDILKHYGLKFTGSQESILQIDEIFISDENDSDYYVSSAWIQSAAQELRQYVQDPPDESGHTREDEHRVINSNSVVNDDPGVADTPIHTPSHVVCSVDSRRGSQKSMRSVPNSPLCEGAKKSLIYCDNSSLSAMESPQLSRANSPRGSASNSPTHISELSRESSKINDDKEISETPYSPKYSPTYSPQQSPRYSPTQSPIYNPIASKETTEIPHPDSCSDPEASVYTPSTETSHPFPDQRCHDKSETSNQWDLIYVKSSRL